MSKYFFQTNWKEIVPRSWPSENRIKKCELRLKKIYFPGEAHQGNVNKRGQTDQNPMITDEASSTDGNLKLFHSAKSFGKSRLSME